MEVVAGQLVAVAVAIPVAVAVVVVVVVVVVGHNAMGDYCKKTSC